MTETLKVKKADQFNKKFENEFLFKNKRFSEIDNLKLKNENIKGIIFDLGYSYSQIKDPEKGLSFNSKGKLNMKMGINDFSAKEVINDLSSEELTKIFKFFGEEHEAKRIVKKILAERKKKEIDTPLLVEIIEKTKIKKNFRNHSATKIFQALRIFVNKEISELINGLIAASKILKKDGVLAVVTFHSLEDKIVKYFLKNLSENKSVSRYTPIPKINSIETLFKMPEKKPKKPSLKELNENLSSRSAKLRYAIKKKDTHNIVTDIQQKFKHLIDIEDYGKKL